MMYEREKENYEKNHYNEEPRRFVSSNPNRQSGNINKSKDKLARADAHEYERKMQDLLEKIEIVESKLKTTNDQKFKILQKLKETEDENELIKDQLSKQVNSNQKQNEEISKLNQKLNEVLKANKNINDKCKTKFEILNKELEDKDTNLDKLLSQMKAKDETIKFYSVNNDFAVKNNNIFKTDIDQLNKEKEELESKIQSLEKQLDEMYVSRKSESAMLLEIEHLKDDNIRLLQMLKTTEEFKDFAYLAEDISGGIRYIKSDSDSKLPYKRGKSAHPFTKECEKKKIEDNNPLNDDNWVPIDAYNCAHDFRNKYKVELSDILINDLLSALNKIWRERERKQLQRLKTKYQNEIIALRSKISMRSPFDEFTAVKTINKLKKELKNTREDLRNQIVQKNKLKTVPSGLDLVDNALKVANNFSKTKKSLENEIKLLKNKLNEKEEVSNQENTERLKFNEGCFWMIGRVLTEFESYASNVDQLVLEYHSRVKNITNDYEFNNKIYHNAKAWFLQSLESMIEEISEKYKEWQFNTQKNVDTLKI